MRNSTIIFVLIALIYSCTTDPIESTEKDLTGISVTGKWKVIKATHSMSCEEKPDTILPFQESYLLNGDGTFVKTRIENEDTLTVSGTYAFVEGTQAYKSADYYIKLKHPSESTIIVNCENSLNEYLFFTEDQNLKNNANACDRMYLEYQKADNN
ncbi:MAG TPA: hypothetical protein VFI78_00300 [Salinimicrobium sp.]|nr:hypothetical protein [Salinimicrobium sp.]